MKQPISIKILRRLWQGLLSLIGVGALVVVVAWLAGTFETKIEPGQQPPAKRKLGDAATDTVRNVSKPSVQESVGTLKAKSRTAISSKVLATIQTVLVAAGDEVAVGEVLVHLDSGEYEARLRQAEQVLAAVEATRQEAELDFARFESLVEKNAASRSDYDKSVGRLRVAEADVARAKQAVTESQVLLSYTTLRAPNAGRIVDRLAEPGDTASPGVPLLVVYDASTLRLEAPVPAHLALQMKSGQTLQVYMDALEKSFHGTIDEIVPQADAPSRSFLVKANLPSSPTLYEGMFGRLRIPTGIRNHLCLAADAIQTVGQLQFVDVVQDDNTLQRRYIRTGREGEPGRIEVLSGLDAGERVVMRK